MSNFSDFKGGSGGGVSSYDTSIALDSKQFGLGAASVGQTSYLTDSNLGYYCQAVRIRGLDTASKAYGGVNVASKPSATGGSMQHTFILMSADQTTGAITLENCIQTLNTNSSSSDYSTFVKTSDEWTGRYTYKGNIPRNNQNHKEGYDLVRITSAAGGHVDQHTETSTSVSNVASGNHCTTNTYVAPNERRLGGTVTHTVAARSYQMKARALQYAYSYHASALGFSGTEDVGFTGTTDYTCFQVTLMNQWDVTNVPYYTEFMSVTEGLYARRSSNNAWSNIGTEFTRSQDYQAFFLSNGGTVIRTNVGTCYLITSSGVKTQISAANVLSTLSTTVYKYKGYCWNVGTDEWLQALPNSKFVKFKINPTTGAFTSSNKLEIASLKDQSFDERFNHVRGIWSSLDPTQAPVCSAMFTYGTENSSGAGYGKSKLFHIGADQTSKTICAATYDIANLVSTLQYP
jgi:hypothetical protein